MDIKNKIKSVLTDNYGEFSTYLEKLYEEKLTEKLSSDSILDKKIWATYNQVLIEINLNLNNTLLLKEFLYLITEDNISNDVILFFIEKIENKTNELDRLYIKIKNFN
jgi:hypothetical protein